METIGTAAIKHNEDLCAAIENGELTPQQLHKELIHFIYKLLFLFIVEDRGLLYAQDDDTDNPQIEKWQSIYSRYYAVGRLRTLSEYPFLKKNQYYDLWMSLFETFRLFEDEAFGAPLGLKPLGSVLFAKDSLPWLRQCRIDNHSLLTAFGFLDQFQGEQGNMVKINYTALDVEEFGSVYEGILELRPIVSMVDKKFYYAQGLDRQSTSSYYTRPDLVNSLIKTALVPVIEDKLKACSTREEREKALLDMKVCDAACGSGHFVLAMARTIAWHLCVVRTGEDNPASRDYRQALREVIQKCVYAVDYNPDAVELCKVVLWIEGFCAGKPLSFLDHHIRCGNSVVGVTDLNVLLDALPRDAFKVHEHESNPNGTTTLLMRFVRRINEAEAERNKTGAFGELFANEQPKLDKSQIELGNTARSITSLPEESLDEEKDKADKWEAFMSSPQVECLRRAADIYTYAFYRTYTYSDFFERFDDFTETGYTMREDVELPSPATIGKALLETKEDYDGPRLSDDFKAEVQAAADRYRFFHWSVEFPEVFAQGGFDAMCGNPPWDKIKVEDKKWFEQHGRSDIVNAGTAAQRKRAIAELPNTDPELFAEYIEAQNDAEAMSRFIRISGRFSLTATGDIDLYPLFAEHCMNCTRENWGLVLPTGIAVNDTNKDFFSKLIDENRLISLYDFENRERLFDIHRMFKFCLLTVSKAQPSPREVHGGFYLTRLDHLLDPNRIYTLQTSDFALLNPNTKTCPVFRTSKDAELTAKTYRRSVIIQNEITGDNPWNVKLGSMLHMSGDSDCFHTYAQMVEMGAELQGNCFVMDDETYVPLYEGKMIWHYNHHYGTWPTYGERPNTIDTPDIDELANPESIIVPWYWVPQSTVTERLKKIDNEGNVLWEWKHKWMMGFRQVSNSQNERTCIISTYPNNVGAGDTIINVFSDIKATKIVLFQSMVSSIVFDYFSKQKVGGSHVNAFLFKQFPILRPEQFTDSDKNFIIPRVAELTYFNHDLDGWAEELYDELTDEQQLELPQLGEKKPFIYDPERRAVLQAELDAIIGHLYGLNTEDMRYILDPEDVCGPGCINETFRVLKSNEIRQYGEYRTKRLVLEAWERMGYND
ncbi:MAG: restriction endonuclease [Bacteroidales bacterium]|nr:restriction endonuclease [Bacteroidales bacterium]